MHSSQTYILTCNPFIHVLWCISHGHIPYRHLLLDAISFAQYSLGCFSYRHIISCIPFKHIGGCISYSHVLHDACFQDTFVDVIISETSSDASHTSRLLIRFHSKTSVHVLLFDTSFDAMLAATWIPCISDSPCIRLKHMCRCSPYRHMQSMQPHPSKHSTRTDI